MEMLGLQVLLVSCAACWAVTPAVVRLAHRVGAVDHPDARKIHHAPTPRIGGVSVFTGFMAGLLWAAWRTGNFPQVPTVTVYWSVLAAAAFALFLLGLLDDLRHVSFVGKFAVQAAAAAAVWSAGFRVEILAVPLRSEPWDLGLWSLPITVLWIVGVTNAINLLDGLDGLAAGTALIMTLAVAVIAWYRDQLGVTAASVALVGSLLGFLYWNFNPARIFLGDSGSMFLGFVLAVISIRGSQKGSTAVAVLVPLLVLALPLLDTGLAIVRRLYRLGNAGSRASSTLRYVVRNASVVFLPDRGHVHHQLLDRGLSHRGAVVLLYSVVAVMAGAALALVVLNSPFLAALLVSVLTGSILAFLFLVRRAPRPISRAGRPAPEPAEAVPAEVASPPAGVRRA